MKWKDVMQVLSCKLRKICALKDEIKREDELISHLWNDENTRKITSLWLKYCHDRKESKSIKKAEIFKDTGNKQFQAKNYSESIQSYTKCAIYAPEHSPLSSVAIANRSAALFFLNRYSDCIKDIELAIKLNYPKELHYKLDLRLMQCYLKLGKSDLAKKLISNIRALIDDPNYITPSLKDDIKKRISGITFNGPCTPDESENIDDLLDLRSILLFDENPNFPHASSSIDRKFNEELGRHVIANRFIKKGEVLFLEKPVSSVVANLELVDRICHHCNHSITDILVPCSKCLNTFYCDTNCLNEAWSSYHCWECPGNQMNIWKEVGIAHLAMKVFLTCTTTTDIIKFNEIQNLITNFDKVAIEDLIVYGIAAVALTSYLLEYTDFFQRNDINDHLVKKFVDKSLISNFHVATNDDKHVFVSSLLLRHILQLVINSHAISKQDKRSKEHGSARIEDIIVASGMFPSISMMNHSCDHNIIIIFKDQYMIIRALKDIATNEEIFNCYGPHYRQASTKQRQERLSRQYYFTCKCKPCTQPNLQHFLERFTAMNCSKCNGALCNIKNSLFCLDCSDNPKYFQDNKIKQAETLFQAAKSCIAQQKIGEALNKLKKCLNIRRRILYQYNEDITFTLDLMSELYMRKGKFASAIECMENIILAVTERSGPSSIELLYTIYNFIDQCILYLQEKLNIPTSSYKALSTLLTTTDEYFDKVEELAELNFGSWSYVYNHIKAKRNNMTPII